MAIVSVIAAMSKNRVIGRDNKLPWYIPEDLEWFKKKTHGKPVIMGRKTHESIGKKLPGRLNIVISRDKNYVSPYKYISVHNSLAEAIDKYKNNNQELVIIGGAEIYKEAIPMASKMYITKVNSIIEGDTFFPDYDEAEWEEKDNVVKGTKGYILNFCTLEKK